MKNEERHKLHENELDKLATQLTKSAVPTFEKYYNQILWAVSGILLVAAIYIYWSRSANASSARAWGDLVFGMNSPESLKEVAREHSKSTVGIWASINAAEGFLAEASAQAFRDKDQFEILLEDAKAEFEHVLEQSNLPETVHERALIGLARVEESLATTDLEPAIAAYQKFLDKFPESPLRTLAAKRIKKLSSSDAKDFYAWYAEQNPKPEPIQKPQDGPTGNLLNMPSVLEGIGPEMPELDLEELDKEDSKKKKKKTSTEEPSSDEKIKSDDSEPEGKSKKTESDGDSSEEKKPADDSSEEKKTDEKKTEDKKDAEKNPFIEEESPTTNEKDSPKEEKTEDKPE